MCAREEETQREKAREKERETTEIYRIQSTDMPESERARKGEKIGLGTHQFFLSLQGIRIQRMGHKKMVFTMKICKCTSQKQQKQISTGAMIGRSPY